MPEVLSEIPTGYWETSYGYVAGISIILNLCCI